MAKRTAKQRRELEDALQGVRGLGEAKIDGLVERFGSLAAIAHASTQELTGVPGIGDQMAQAILEAVGLEVAAGRGNGSPRPELSAQEFQDRFERMVSNIGQVIKGKDDIVRRALTCMLAGGHALFEDYPGTGKTMLARSIAQTINASTSRIQCTPDLLPADVTGSPVLDRETGAFDFRAGPVFANILLADEVNRANPKTQSALLEAMGEGQVTVDNVTRQLPRPFFVIATQNPLELAGTFPLPEAQLDRFLLKLSLGYADRDAERELMLANTSGDAIDALESIVSTQDVIEMIEWAKGVTTGDAVIWYIIDLVRATREDPSLQIGGSSRASLALMRASKVVAASQGRDDVLPDDVKHLVHPVLNHRLILTPDALLRDETVEDVVARVVDRVKVPLGVGDRESVGA